MRIWNFEGTTQEFSEIAGTLGFGDKATDQSTISLPPIEEEQRSDENRFVSVDEAIVVLTRLSLSNNVYLILRLLYESGSRRLFTEDLRKATHLNGNQFRGLMGAFGRRLSNTVPSNVHFWDDKWDGNEYQKTWTLPASVREALEKLKIV
jgi:uncharacterized protein YneF (UPF0154 family)